MLFVLVGNLPKRSKSPSFQKSVGEKFQAITLIFLMIFFLFLSRKVGKGCFFGQAKAWFDL